MERLAIIVPYRDREAHLKQFVPHLHRFFGDFPYRLLIIEQAPGAHFNRGKLLNIGFALAKEMCDYVCFHDVDMLPVSADYSYPKNPTHLATHVEQFEFDMPYGRYFDGVTLFNQHDFELVNGYYNGYSGWGLEDDDLRLRCEMHGLTIDSRPGTYLSLQHRHAVENSAEIIRNRDLFERFHSGDATMLADGLNSLEFKTLDRAESAEFIKFTVEI